VGSSSLVSDTQASASLQPGLYAFTCSAGSKAGNFAANSSAGSIKNEICPAGSRLRLHSLPASQVHRMILAWESDAQPNLFNFGQLHSPEICFKGRFKQQ
jgi:hypothetical protein